MLSLNYLISIQSRLWGIGLFLMGESFIPLRMLDFVSVLQAGMQLIETPQETVAKCNPLLEEGVTINIYSDKQIS